MYFNRQYQILIDRDRFRDIVSDTMLQQFQKEYDLVINSPPDAIESPDDF